MLDVVGETAVQLDELVAQLHCEIQLPESMADFFSVDGSALPAMYSCRRRFQRISLRVFAGLHVRQSSPAIPRQAKWHRIYLKDVSHGGAAFLHSEQLFPRERMKILMPDDRIRRLLPGRSQAIIEVIRCRRIGEKCFDIGSKFVDSLHD